MLTLSRLQRASLLISDLTFRQDSCTEQRNRITIGYHQRVQLGTSIPELMVMFNYSTQRQTLDYLCIQAKEIKDAYMRLELCSPRTSLKKVSGF